jgi:tetratricopeptide (TPR) repeat protein
VDHGRRRVVRTRSVVGVCLVIGVLIAGCSKGEKRTPEERFRGYLENGNAAFRERNYKDAIASYRKAVQVKPGDGAGYFGLYMAYQATGQAGEAGAAYAKATELSPGLGGQAHPMPGDPPAVGGMSGTGGAHSMGMPADSIHSGAVASSDTAGGAEITSEWLRTHSESRKKPAGK